jgi:hypothetical protein
VDAARWRLAASWLADHVPIAGAGAIFFFGQFRRPGGRGFFLKLRPADSVVIDKRCVRPAVAGPLLPDLGNGLTELMQRQAAAGSHTFPLLTSAPPTVVAMLLTSIAHRSGWKTNLDFAARTRPDMAMNSQKTGLRVASLLFAVIALGHLVRLLKHAQVIVGSHTIPLWMSAPLAVIAVLLSFWMWKLSK